MDLGPSFNAMEKKTLARSLSVRFIETRSMVVLTIIVAGIFIHTCLSAQLTIPFPASYGSDPANMRSRAVLDAESYIFHQPARFYALRFGFLYGLQNEKHLFGLSVPFVHNIFEEDLQGYENTTGLGDIQMMYMMALTTGKSIGLSRISPYLEVTTPTGESQLGRGAGTWLYKPGIIFKFQSTPEIVFYPEVRFQFSGEEANSQGGADGLPDPEDPETDGKLQNLTFLLPVVVEIESIQGWFSLNASYTQSLTEKEYFIFMRTDFGKMIGDKTSAALSISKFIAGQPRLNVIVQAKFQFFLGNYNP